MHLSAAGELLLHRAQDHLRGAHGRTRNPDGAREARVSGVRQKRRVGAAVCERGEGTACVASMQAQGCAACAGAKRTSSSRSMTFVCTATRPAGGVASVDMARMPAMHMYMVRGMGVADSESTSTSDAASLIFSFSHT